MRRVESTSSAPDNSNAEQRGSSTCKFQLHATEGCRRVSGSLEPFNLTPSGHRSLSTAKSRADRWIALISL
jgi:hypothetical protein